MLLWPFALTNHPVNFVHILTDKGMQRRRYTCLCSSVFEKHNNASVLYRQVCKNQSTYIPRENQYIYFLIARKLLWSDKIDTENSKMLHI
jgi:hypothetical protein